MLVVVFIILAGIGLPMTISWGEVCKAENPVFLTFLSGVSSVIAMIAIAMTVYGETPQTVLAIVGILGTVLFNIRPIKEGLDYQAKTKYAKDISGFTKFRLGPVFAWFKHTMVGLGTCTKILLYCTLIGIPVVKGMKNSDRAINAYARQRELEEEKKMLDELEQINRARAQDKK